MMSSPCQDEDKEHNFELELGQRHQDSQPSANQCDMLWIVK